MNIFKIYTVKNQKILSIDVYPLFTFLNMAASDKTNPQNSTEPFPGIIETQFLGMGIVSEKLHF